MIRPGSPLAPKGLAGMCAPAAALFMLTQGCLMPQSVDPANTRPHTIPRVDLTGLFDYMFKPTMLLYPRGQNDPANCHCVLKVKIPTIVADDPTVNVEGRLFVDYDLAVPTSQRRLKTVPLDGDFQSSETTRGPVELDIDADVDGLASGIHVYELVLAEQQGFALDSVFPPQRATKPTWDSSLLKFVVEVQRQFDPLRPTCDVLTAPPQERVCSP